MEHGLKPFLLNTETRLSAELQGVFACNGVALDEREVRELAGARTEALHDAGLIGFKTEGFTGYVKAVSSLPCMPILNAKDFLIEACGMFYEVRAALSSDVPDSEITDALCEALAEHEGAFESVDTACIIEELRNAYRDGEPYTLSDDEGKVYRWDPAIWGYDEQSAGWDGEAWGGDADER